MFSRARAAFVLSSLLVACTTFGADPGLGDGGDAAPPSPPLPGREGGPPNAGGRFCAGKPGICADFDDTRPRQVYVDGVERTGGILGAPGGTLSVDPTTRSLVASAPSGTQGAFLSLPAVKGRFVLTLDVFEAPRAGRVDLVRFPGTSPSGAVHVWVEGDQVSVGAEGGKALAGFGRPPGPFTVYLSNDRFGVALASQEPMTVAVSLPIAATEVLVGVGPPATPTPAAARIDDVWLRPAP